MFEQILIVYYQTREALAEGGLRSLIHKRVFWRRIATPVEMDVMNLPDTGKSHNPGYQVTELKLEDLRAGVFSFTVPSRDYKAIGNLKKGWRCFSFIQGSTVIADIWCVTPYQDGKVIVHSDLNMLGIIPEGRDAYAFDMFIDPNYRGKNLAVLLQHSLHMIMKREGIHKVYGFYWDDNRPALWTHRTLKFQELPKRCVSRFFCLYTGQPLHPNEKSPIGTERVTRSTIKEDS